MALLSDALVQQLLVGRHIASVGTLSPDGTVHMVSVWFLFEQGRVYVATSTRTRKARNLQSNPNISIMIDCRDEAASFGANISGAARILTGDASQKWNEHIHAKYLSSEALADPRVGPVFAAWDDATIEITPQSVFSWDMREADRQVFGGAFAAHPGYLLPIAR
jgi:general stress protein 26